MGRFGNKTNKRTCRNINEVNSMKTLVAYYSRTGNTEFVAEKIAEYLGAEVCEVIDKKSRKGRFGFLKGVTSLLEKN